MNKISRLIFDTLGSGPHNVSSFKGALWYQFGINRRESALIIRLLFVSGAAHYDGRKRIILNPKSAAARGEVGA